MRPANGLDRLTYYKAVASKAKAGDKGQTLNIFTIDTTYLRQL
jgi:hypothetical protein